MRRGLVGTLIVAAALLGAMTASAGAGDSATPLRGGCPGDEYCTGPTTTIVKGPEAKTTRKRATFKFTATEPKAGFRCALDNEPFRRCDSPKKVRRLKPRKHQFRVQAVVNGLGGPVAKYRWKVIEVPTACRGGCTSRPRRRG